MGRGRAPGAYQNLRGAHGISRDLVDFEFAGVLEMQQSH